MPKYKLVMKLENEQGVSIRTTHEGLERNVIEANPFLAALLRCLDVATPEMAADTDPARIKLTFPEGKR